MPRPNKVFTGLIGMVIGIIGTVAATSFAIGSEKGTTSTRLDQNEKDVARLYDLISNNLLITQADIRSIQESTTQIREDVAGLKAISSNK